MSWSARYFTKEEMMCKCGCGRSDMDQDFMDLLDALRDVYGKPMIITSGYRCPNHPLEKRKEKSGAHSTGKAADIAVIREDALDVLGLALEFRRSAKGMDIPIFTGFGVAQKGTGRFIHLDSCTMADDNLPRPTMWSY